MQAFLRGLVFLLSSSFIIGMVQPEPPLLAERGLLELPKEFSGKPVYYLHTPCIKGVSCGYYTLNNAIQLERRLKNELPESVEEFVNFCMRQTTSTEKLVDGTTYSQRLSIAAHYKLSPMWQLNTTPRLTGGYDVTIHKDVATYLKRGVNLHEVIDSFLQGQFNALHFIGALEVVGEPHAILLSVIRQKDGTSALYVFDNCNLRPGEYPMMYRYIEYLLDNVVMTSYAYSPASISGAIKYGNVSLLNYLLSKPEVLSEIQNPSKSYLLDAFNNYGNRLETLNILLSHHVFIPQQALYKVTESNCTNDENKEVIKLLLQAGADPFAQSGPLGKSLATELLKDSNDERKQTCLKIIESYFTDAQRAKLEELKKSFAPGYTVEKLIETGKVDPSPFVGRNATLGLYDKEINNLEGLERINHKDEFRKLLLNRNYITKIPKDAFVGFDNLEEIDLTLNKISFIDPLAFSHLKNLRKLNLGGNELSYLDPAVIKNILESKGDRPAWPFISLDLESNRLTKENIEAIKAVLPPSVSFSSYGQREPEKKVAVQLQLKPTAKPAAAKQPENNPALQLEAAKRAPLKLTPLARPAPAVKK